jgi:hypothetical protein
MNMNTPHKWVMLKLTNNEGKTHYRVFASWYGGYANSDSWRMNSGVTKIEATENYFDFIGSSGSVYRCGRQNYGTSGYSQGVLSGIIKDVSDNVTIEILPDDTNFEELTYE